MTPDDITGAADRILEDRRARGFPDRIEDPAALQAIRRVLRAAQTDVIATVLRGADPPPSGVKAALTTPQPDDARAGP